MATNQFKPFATGPAANVTPQEDWEALPALLSGFTSGKASSAQVNKALRQTSFIASALAEFVSEKSGEDVLDDGDVAGFIAKMTSGFAAEYLSRENPFGDIKADGSAAVSTALANLGLGEGAPIIGSPFAWPSTKMPNEVFSSMAGMTFLKMNGAT
ncbi:phage tail protein, partial [Enterobacteriaceae bacterium H11S18]|nr:phage tail protein [Dryocola clanedunensis]